jgi:hypothetical protein
MPIKLGLVIILTVGHVFIIDTVVLFTIIVHFVLPVHIPTSSMEFQTFPIYHELTNDFLRLIVKFSNRTIERSKNHRLSGVVPYQAIQSGKMVLRKAFHCCSGIAHFVTANIHIICITVVTICIIVSKLSDYFLLFLVVEKFNVFVYFFKPRVC